MIPTLYSDLKIYWWETVLLFNNNLATIMQGCTTYIQPSQGCMHLAKDDHKVVCTLQMLMQGCHKLGCNKLAARLPQPRNFHMGN